MQMVYSLFKRGDPHRNQTMTTIRNYELTRPGGIVMTRFEFNERTNTVTVRHCDMRPGPGSGQFACYQGRSVEYARRVWNLCKQAGATLTKESVTTY